MKMYSDKEWLWLLPNKGDAVIKWNPTNYVTVEYSCAHLGIHCYDYANDNCRIMNLFSSAYFYGEYVYLAPGAGDMFVKVNKVTGEVLEWRTGIDLSAVAHNCYSECYYHKSWFLPTDVPEKCRLVSAVEGKIYDIDLNCDATKCRKVNFDSEQIQEIMSGFVYEPIYGQYCCLEDEYNSLKDYIENTFHYNKFDRDRQMEYVSLISNNIDGSAGRRIYEATKQS